MARYTSVLPIIIYRARWWWAKCCYRMLAAIFSSQNHPHQAANTISSYIQEIRCALSVAVPSASCLLSSYREIMSSSFKTAIAVPGSIIIWEQKDLILSMLLCLAGFAESFRVDSNRADFKASASVVWCEAFFFQSEDGVVSVLICCGPYCAHVKLFTCWWRQT